MDWSESVLSSTLTFPPAPLPPPKTTAIPHVIPPPPPLSLSLSPVILPLNECVFDEKPFMDLMEFSSLFSWIWEMCLGKKSPAQASLPHSTVHCSGQHFCWLQTNEKFPAYRTGQYRSEAWLTSVPCEGKKSECNFFFSYFCPLRSKTNGQTGI